MENAASHAKEAAKRENVLALQPESLSVCEAQSSSLHVEGTLSSVFSACKTSGVIYRGWLQRRTETLGRGV